MTRFRSAFPQSAHPLLRVTKLAWFLPVFILCLPFHSLGAQSSAELQQRGIQAFQSQEFAVAERLFQELVQQHPSAAAFSYLATTEGALGKYPQAINHFRKSIELGNDTPLIRYNLALSYLREHQPRPAIRELKIALAKGPQFTAARYALGVALLSAGQPREALFELKQTQGSLSKNPAMWVSLARAGFSAGDSTEALQTVDRAVDALPQNPRLFVELAQVCLRYRQPQKARELLEDATESEPGNNSLKLLLAEVSLQAEEPQEALAVLENVPVNAGPPGQVDFLRGRAYLLRGDLKAASPLLAAAAAADPESLDYLSSYAELQALRQNYQGALLSLNRAHEAHHDSPGLAYQIAFIDTLMSRYQEAMGACQEAIRFAPNFDQAYFLLGAIHFERKEWLPSERDFRHALSLKPHSGLYHSALGAAMFKAGSLLESRREFDAALALDSHALLAYFWRAQLFAFQHDPAKAIADLETFVALDPNYPEAYAWLARLYRMEKKDAKARGAQDLYNALQQKTGSSRIPLLLQQLGMIHFLEARGQSN